MSKLHATARHADDGQYNEAFALPRRFEFQASDTDGAFSTFFEDSPPEAGPPLHVHHREHEMSVVLEGRVRFHCEGDEVVLEAGGCIVIPPKARHSYKNVGEETAKMVFTLTPGGFEGFFEKIEAEGLQPTDDMPRIAEIAAEYDLEFVGPPLD